MIYGLIGGVCLLAGVAAAGSGTLNKSDNKRNETVSVVSYKNMEDKGKSDKSANATTGASEANTNNAGNDGNVYDADYKVEDDNK